MSSEPNQSPEPQKQPAGQVSGKTQWDEEATINLLKTRVDSEEVVNFIENMVEALGSAASGQFSGRIPQQQPVRQAVRKYQSKAVTQIMQKLARVAKYPDLAGELGVDPVVTEWLDRNGCKKTEYYDDLECAQELTGFFGGHRQFDLAMKAANKALAITLLHRREDEELLAELNWVLAELHAATDNMEVALNYMRKCLAVMEPGADVGHASYNELLLQLEETRQRCCAVAVS
jgi:hypothetical protein